MKITTVKVAAILLLSLLVKLNAAQAGQEPTASPDPFQQRVPGVSLRNQDVIDGIAMLSREAGLTVSVEYRLGKKISGSAPQRGTLIANVGPGTVSEILDGLCALDGEFTWKRDGNMTNVLPRASAGDPSYFLNRTISELTFRDTKNVQDAVFGTAAALPGPKEQIAIMQTGVPLTFSRSWNATFHDVTVREAFNLIAKELGPNYGWQFSGADDFRILTFHQGILPKPGRVGDTGAR